MCCSFMAKERERHWTQASLTWRLGASHVLTSWFTRPVSPFRHVTVLELGKATLDVRHLSVLQCPKKLHLNFCELIAGPHDDPWPLLSSGVQSLKVVFMRDCTFVILDALKKKRSWNCVLRPWRCVSTLATILLHLLLPQQPCSYPWQSTPSPQPQRQR